MKMKLNWGLSCDYADEDGAAFTNIFDSANSLLELKNFTGHFGVSGSRITSRTPRGTAAVARAKIISFSIREPTILVRKWRI